MGTMRVPHCRLVWASIVCAALAACASSPEPAADTVVRTHVPRAYEKTITNYFAFRMRGPQKNMKFSFGEPEPGNCAIDGYLNSIRGWVVPVMHETFSGEPSGRETIRVNAKQYWFWFLGDTIAGITPRKDLCPGVASAFDLAPTGAATTGRPDAALVVPVAAEAPAVERAEPPKPAPATRAPSRAKAPKKKRGTSQRAKKPAAAASEATR
jgi:hypothetical protein